MKLNYARAVAKVAQAAAALDALIGQTGI